MSSFVGSLALAVSALAVTGFISYSPYSMETRPPTSKWADQPMKLVTTPYRETQKTDVFTAGATHMALVHNAMIRGYNSIYLQAPLVREDYKEDFAGYSLTWAKFVASHHDDEELNLFDAVSEILDDHSIWAETQREHNSFIEGIESFRGYITGLESPKNMSGSRLVEIMDSFREPFEHHLHSEVKTIVDLAYHHKAPVEGSAEAAKARDTFRQWGKQTISKAGMVDVLPFFLLNHDGTFEDATWETWPPMPTVIRWIMTNIVGAFKGHWWKFASCDHAGKPRELFAIEYRPWTEKVNDGL